MRNQNVFRTSLGSLSVSAFLGAVLLGAMYPPASTSPASLAAAAGVTGADLTRARGTPAYTLEFAAITSGGSVLPDGSIMIIGQPAVGTVSNEDYTLEVGAVPVLLSLTTGNGDLDKDGLLTLEDHRDGFLTCFSGPRAEFPEDPFCWRFDMDRDNDVDIDDFRRFQSSFGD